MIIFQNEGELDINAIKTMGVSVKEDGAIGFFGTGLKYAIAVLLREEQRITIWAGGTKLEFDVSPITVRGKQFDVVTMNDEQLGFTTELGKTWEMWMAFRELYCNCKDEGGETTAETMDDISLYKGRPGSTTIVVTGDKFKAEYFNRHENFLEGTPLFSDGNVEIYEKNTAYLFYKGVRVGEGYSKPMFAYNMLNKIDLTEDRTIKSPWDVHAPIARAIMVATDPVLLYKCICAPQGSMERGYLEFTAEQFSPEFEQVAIREWKADSLQANASILKFIHKLNLKGLHPVAELSNVQRKQLEKARLFIDRLGFSYADYTLIVVETLGPSIMAKARRPEREIIISKQCFDKGTKFLASTLIEEVIHLREGLNDNTTSMQTYLFDKIISLGEELAGEPL